MLSWPGLNADYSSACNQRAVFDTHALTLAERRRLVIREVTRLAVFHMHAHRIIGCAAYVFFDRIAAQTAAERAKDRHAGTTASTSKLITDKTTRHRATYRADTRSLAFMLHSRDCLYRAAGRAIGGLRRLWLLCVIGLLHRCRLRHLLRHLRRRLLLLRCQSRRTLLCLLFGELILLRLRLLLLSCCRGNRLRGLRGDLCGLGLVVQRRRA